MRKSVTIASKPSSVTVGELISELCRLPDHAVVSFRCPLQKREMRFSRIASQSRGSVEIELEPAPKNAPNVAA
jgi:hypothetical protein